jgi:hypothetical protein
MNKTLEDAIPNTKTEFVITIVMLGVILLAPIAAVIIGLTYYTPTMQTPVWFLP